MSSQILNVAYTNEVCHLLCVKILTHFIIHEFLWACYIKMECESSNYYSYELDEEDQETSDIDLHTLLLTK